MQGHLSVSLWCLETELCTLNLPAVGMGHCQPCFLSSSEVPRTPLTLRNPLVEVASVGGFVCSAALASVAVLGLLLLCTVTIAVSRNGLISGNLFFLNQSPTNTFWCHPNWPLEIASLVPRAVDLRNWLQTTRRLFFIIFFASCQNVDLSWLEVSQLKGELQGGTSSGVLSQALCPCRVLGMGRKRLVQLGLLQTDQFKPHSS